MQTSNPTNTTTLFSTSVLMLDPQGRVLLVKRKRGPGVCMPGGKVDAGETIVQAGIREVFEETGLILNEKDLHVIYRAPCTSEEGVVYDTTTFLASAWQGELGGQEPELAPYWGSWKELIENSPFGHYNHDMAWQGFVGHLGKMSWWTTQMEQWMATLTNELDMKKSPFTGCTS